MAANISIFYFDVVAAIFGTNDGLICPFGAYPANPFLTVAISGGCETAKIGM
jgi:hypothetical protein